MLMILMIIVCIFAGMWIRFGRNLAHVQNSLIKEMDNIVMHGDSNIKHLKRNQTEQINHVTEKIDVLSEAYRALGLRGNFQNCSQETTACNFTYYSFLRRWLYCDTPNLQTNKRVRLIP